MKRPSLKKLLSDLAKVRKQLEETVNGGMHFDRFRRAYEPLEPDDWIEGFEGVQIDGTTSAGLKGLDEHVAELVELEAVLNRVIINTGKGRPEGTVSKKARDLHARIVRETRALWKETGKRPTISTNPLTDEVYGELIDRVNRTRGEGDELLSGMKIRDAVRQLMKDREIIASGLFTDKYDNRPQKEVYKRFQNKGN